MTITGQIHTAITRVPATAWTCAYNADCQPRDGAWIAEVTDMVDLTGWPKGMRLIVRKERPHPGAQLRVTDHDGNRLTAFATNTPTGQLADLELRHRRRARAEDRLRAAKDAGLANLPLHGSAANRIWVELVLLAQDLIAWAQMLALADHSARRWEPKRLRLRLFSAAARVVATGRRRLLRFSCSWPWGELLTSAIERLRLLPAPLWVACPAPTRRKALARGPVDPGDHPSASGYDHARSGGWAVSSNENDPSAGRRAVMKDRG